MSVTSGVRADLDGLPREFRSGGLAASALELASQLDDPGVSATAKAACARALRECLDRLRELAPPAVEDDRLDELAGRRAGRVGGAAS